MKLGELLVANKVLTVTQLNQALKAQSVYGGRLGTNLVELGFLSETQLTQFLAKQLGIQAAGPEDFANIQPDVLVLIPAAMAEKYKCVPIALENHKLKVAFSDPLDLKGREELTFRVGHPIIPLVASEMLLQYAMEKFYDMRPRTRYVQIQDEEPADSDGDIRKFLVSGTESLEPDREKVIQSLGSYSLQELSQDLFQASSKDAVFRSLFRFLENYFSSVAVFIPRQEEIWLWIQQGFEPSKTAVRGKVAGVQEASAIVQVFENRDLELQPNLTPVDRQIIKRLGGDLTHACALFPMIYNGRVAAVFLGCVSTPQLDSTVTDEVDSIQEALAKGSIALQMVALKNKLLMPNK